MRENSSEFIDNAFFSLCDSAFEKPNKLLTEFLKIFDVIADGVIVTDADDKILLINKNHQLLSFLKPEDIIGKSAFDLTRRYKYWTKESEFDVLQLKQDLKPRDFRMRSQSGHDLILTATPVLNDAGKLTWLVFTSRDMGKIHELEKRLGKRTNFSSNDKKPDSDQSDEFVWVSKPMQEIMEIIDKVSNTNSYVFLMGESGVGKDRIARNIHSSSPWASGPFIHVNCAAIPDTLFESELFGYEKGSFTGARNEGKMGLIEIASGGTLYLDEITELSPGLQAKLLQVLQERTFRRVGGTETIKFSARVISSTNRDMHGIIAGKGFRQDLYYRLCVIPIFIPSLRERREDIPRLINLFMKEYNTKHGLDKVLKPDLMKYLCKQPWLGNVRELQHVIERLVIMTDSKRISVSDYSQICTIGKSIQPYSVKDEDILKDSVEKVEIDLLKKAALNSQNTREAAKALGISQATFLRKAKKYNISLIP